MTIIIPVHLRRRRRQCHMGVVVFVIAFPKKNHNSSGHTETLDPTACECYVIIVFILNNASGLHSHYKRLTRRERFAYGSPCTQSVCFTTGCDPVTCRAYLTGGISRFPGHVSIVSRIDHVLTKDTSGNRFSAEIWPISTFCMLISPRITFTTQCHDFYARYSQHYKLMEWKEIGQSADMRRQRVAAVPDASARAFTLQRQPDAHHSRPLRTPPGVV